MNKFVVIVCAVAIAGAAALYLSQSNQSRAPENGDATGATVAAGTPIVLVKVPAQLSALAQSGQTAFNAKCATCHGMNASGLKGAAPPLVHKIYEPSHHGDQSFFMAAQNGVRAHHWPFGNMPPIQGVTTADMKGIVAYVRALQRENGIH